MTTRKPIPKKMRFEIFKRDSFTCQYCGAKAPDAVLHCDHITPVVDGGATEPLNLITSCVGCNLGKGATALSDQTTVAKKMAQAEALSARREQIEMMAEWHRGLLDIDGQSLKVAEACWINSSGVTLTVHGIQKLRKWIREHGLANVLEAIRVVDKYFERGADGGVTVVSAINAFDKIGGVCYINKQKETDPLIARWQYLKGIVRNKWPNFNQFDKINMPVRDLLARGVDMEDVISAMKDMDRSAYQAITQLENWIGDIEKGHRG